MKQCDVIRFVSMTSLCSTAAPDCHTRQIKGRYPALAASFPVVVVAPICPTIVIIVWAWLITQIKSCESVFSLEKSGQGWLKEKTKHTYLGLCLFEIESDNWKKKNVGISPIPYLSHCLVCDLFYYQGNEN